MGDALSFHGPATRAMRMRINATAGARKANAVGESVFIVPFGDEAHGRAGGGEGETNEVLSEEGRWRTLMSSTQGRRKPCVMSSITM